MTTWQWPEDRDRERSYNVGDQILYQPTAGPRRLVVVTEKSEDIKNGRPGFAGDVLQTGELVWGYDSQIVEIKAFKKD
jgi:hypothetical protein